ncbi:hypothetical protein ACWF82_20640 [Nocardia sp. NPDC055053]
MFLGQHVDVTGVRAVQHIEAQAPAGSIDDMNRRIAVPVVRSIPASMATLAERARTGNWLGGTGQPSRTFVALGSGGSSLGPAMACQALCEFASSSVDARFVSSADTHDLNGTRIPLDSETTLFVVTSTTFTTQGTLTNAHAARQRRRVSTSGPATVATQFIAVSANAQAVERFGIDPSHIFRLAGWVGGRCGLHSSVSSPLMIAIGPEQFRRVEAGVHSMDQHFRTTPRRQNLRFCTGVEAEKALATKFLSELHSGSPSDHDSSTNAQIGRCRRGRPLSWSIAFGRRDAISRF